MPGKYTVQVVKPAGIWKPPGDRRSREWIGRLGSQMRLVSENWVVADLHSEADSGLAGE
ncbi:unannotated protein [freshwater metagenome]|uniref:Unannotated protein n=1 Tax=freshwater metagenome TaxID=449393 RepID=A0A6J6Q1R8_9ZZZZ